MNTYATLTPTLLIEEGEGGISIPSPPGEGEGQGEGAHRTRNTRSSVEQTSVLSLPLREGRPDLSVGPNDRAQLEQLCRLCGAPHRRQYADRGVMRTRRLCGREER